MKGYHHLLNLAVLSVSFLYTVIVFHFFSFLKQMNFKKVHLFAFYVFSLSLIFFDNHQALAKI